MRIPWLTPALISAALFCSAATAHALQPRYSDTGQIVRWGSDQVSFALDESLETIDPSARAAVARAAAAWSVAAEDVPSTSTSNGAGLEPGFSQTGGNRNSIIYAHSGWKGAGNALAITVLTYSTESGLILDADIVVNGGKNKFEVVEVEDADADGVESAPISNNSDDNGTDKAYDLQGVVTHEIGHALGLPEDDAEPLATMYAWSSPKETHKRTLYITDQSALRSTYAGSKRDTSLTGCSSKLASGWSAGANTSIGFGLSLVLMALALGIRRMQGRHSRGVGWAAGAGALAAAMAIPPVFGRADLQLMPRAATVKPDADVTVVSAATRWEGGLVVSKLKARIDRCRAARCPSDLQEVEVFGGRMGAFTQIVGAAQIPDVGEQIQVKLTGAKSWEQALRLP